MGLDGEPVPPQPQPHASDLNTLHEPIILLCSINTDGHMQHTAYSVQDGGNGSWTGDMCPYCLGCGPFNRDNLSSLECSGVLTYAR